MVGCAFGWARLEFVRGALVRWRLSVGSVNADETVIIRVELVLGWGRRAVIRS